MQKEQVSADVVYKEIGINYRFFLGWRHALFAGTIVITGAILFQTYKAIIEKPFISGFIPLIGGLICLVVYQLEDRIQDLYRAGIKAGSSLEGEYFGFYSAVDQKFTKTSHSTTLLKTYKYSSIGLFLLGALLIMFMIFK